MAAPALTSRPSDSYWPSADPVRWDRAIVPGLLDAGWTRRAGGECGDPTGPAQDAPPCRKLGAWGHPVHGVPGRPVCAQHAQQRQSGGQSGPDAHP